MNMQESVLYIVLALLGVVIYLLLSQRKHRDDGTKIKKKLID